MADRTSARRLATNTFFVTVNSALVAFSGLLATASGGKHPDKFGIIAIALAGVISCAAWWALLRYYRRLNGAKFAVINTIEERLPVKPFTDEWKVLHPNSASPTDSVLRWFQVIRKFKGNEHREATVVEQAVPLLFATLNVALIVKVVAL